MADEDTMIFAVKVVGGLVTADGANGVIRLETLEGHVQLALPREVMMELMFQALALTPRPNPSQPPKEAMAMNVENWSFRGATDDAFVIEFQPRMGGSASFSLDRQATGELAAGMQSALDRSST